MKTKKSISLILACLLFLAVIPLGMAFGAGQTVTAADIPDPNLLQTLTDLAGAEGELTKEQLAAYTGDLDLKNKNIADITGLRLAKNVTSVDLSGNPITEVPAQGFAYMPGLTTVILPDSVTSIGEMAFYKSFSLDNFVMPDSVTSIGAACFLNVEMTNISLSRNLTEIPEMAFMNCVNLKELNVPASVTAFGENAFAYCAALETINIPANVTGIPDSCFEGCYSLTYVELPDEIKTVGNNAFYKCTNLMGAYIPDGALSVGDGAFMNCEKMVGISIGSNTSVGANAFKNAPLLGNPEVRAIPSEISLEAGDSFTFEQKPLCNISWLSSDSEVLTIDAQGNAVAVKAGTVNVICDGLLSGITNPAAAKAAITFKVTVNAKPGKDVVMKKNVTKAYTDGLLLPTTDYGNGVFATTISTSGGYALPLRYIGEQFGMKVDYLGSGRTKVTNAAGEYVIVTKNSAQMEKYNASGVLIESFTAVIPVFVDQSITYVPLRAVSEALGLGVCYVGSGTTGHGSYVVISDDGSIDSQLNKVLALIEDAYRAGL